MNETSNVKTSSLKGKQHGEHVLSVWCVGSAEVLLTRVFPSLCILRPIGPAALVALVTIPSPLMIGETMECRGQSVIKAC